MTVAAGLVGRDDDDLVLGGPCAVVQVEQPGLAVGLGWAFVTMAVAIGLALVPAVRLVPAAVGSFRPRRVLDGRGRIVPQEKLSDV